MELIKWSKNINSLTDYVKFTEDACKYNKFTKIPFNTSAILALKKIQSFEVQFFSKHSKNGLACIIIERILALPATKNWISHCKELIFLLQFWLNEIKKHIIVNNQHWWTFMTRILTFIKILQAKDASVSNILAEHLTDCLLDLATQEKSNVWQKFEMLHCLNLYCAQSSTEIRFSLKNKFLEYFIKLSTYMSTCGHYPCQFSIMETLLQWLVPHNDQALRSSIAQKLFPRQMYTQDTVDIFLERSWYHFYQDVRDFLNMHNARTNAIVSVVCTKLTIGPTVIKMTTLQDLWLDVNFATNCITVVLISEDTESLPEMNQVCCQVLIITNDNTERAALLRKSVEILLSIKTISPPLIEPSRKQIVEQECDVNIVLGSKNNFKRLDAALRAVFDNKYHLKFDLKTEVSLSPQKTSQTAKVQHTLTESGKDFSHPVEVQRRRHVGGIFLSQRNAVATPSSVSTTSLALLPDKLTALSKIKFDKEPVRVCAQPNLSNLVELNESDESLTNTAKFSTYGLCRKINQNRNKKSQSDTELNTNLNRKRRYLPPVNDLSDLSVPTLYFTDESEINDTFERLSQNDKYKKNNTVDLLIKEALQSSKVNEENKSFNSDAVIGDEKTKKKNIGAVAQCNINEVIENTPMVEFGNIKKVLNRKCTIISKSTSDESNTEAIKTPSFISDRRKKLNTKKIDEKDRVKRLVELQIYDNEAVERFSNQHIVENKHRRLDISPSLVKKINVSSAESSLDFYEELYDNKENINNIAAIDDCAAFINNNRTKVTIFSEADVEECLNKLIETVCVQVNQCTSEINMNKDIGIKVNEEEVQFDTEDEWPLQVLIEKNNGEKTDHNNTVCDLNPKSMHPSKLCYPEGITDQKQQPYNLKIQKQDSPAPTCDSTSARRKRKLYSPKYEEMDNEGYNKTNVMDDDLKTLNLQSNNISKTRKPINTFYKKIHDERKSTIRSPPKKRANSNLVKLPSPKTDETNRLFDQLKKTEDNNKSNIRFSKKTCNYDVYDFTSDSDDNDFIKKKFNMRSIKKSKNSSKIGSDKALNKNKYTKRVKNSDTVSNTSDGIRKKTVSKSNKLTKKTKTFESKLMKETNDLADEKLRAATKDALNTSMVIEKPVVTEEPVLKCDKALEMEFADDTNNEVTANAQYIVLRHKKVKKTDTPFSLKKGKDLSTNAVDRTVSPLPELVVEFIPQSQNDSIDIEPYTFIKNISRICEEELDNTKNTKKILLENDNLDDRSNINVEIGDGDNTIDRDQSETKRRRIIKKDVQNVDHAFELETFEKLDNKTGRKRSRSKNIESTNSIKEPVKKKSKKPTKTVKASKPLVQYEDIQETDVQCNPTIASTRIRVNCDSEDPPPSMALFEKTTTSGHLDFEDFGDTMKDYYAELINTIGLNDKHRENSEGSEVVDIYQSSKSAEKITRIKFDLSKEENAKSPEAFKSRSSKENNSKSPEVCIPRLSMDDISKYLPSSRHSETQKSSLIESVNSKQLVVSIKAMPVEDILKRLPSTSTSFTNDQIKSPVKIIKENTSDTLKKRPQYLNKFISNDSSSDEESVNISENCDIKYDETDIKSSTTKRHLKRRHGKTARDEIDNDDVSTQSGRISNKRDRQTIKTKDRLKTKDSNKADVAPKRSLISPIKNFEDITSNKNIASVKGSACNSDSDDMCVKKIRNIFKKKKSVTTSKAKVSRTVRTIRSPKSTSTPIEVSSPLKPQTLDSRNKKRLPLDVAETVTLAEDGSSSARVRDWMRENQDIFGAAENMAQFKLILQTISESMDKTLAEINQDTSERFAKMFDDMQSQFSIHWEQRQKEMADIAERLAQQLEIQRQLSIQQEQTRKNLEDIKKSWDEVNKSVMDAMKQRTVEIMRVDKNKKEAMVVLLKEDVQAVMDYLERQKQSK